MRNIKLFLFKLMFFIFPALYLLGQHYYNNEISDSKYGLEVLEGKWSVSHFNMSIENGELADFQLVGGILFLLIGLTVFITEVFGRQKKTVSVSTSTLVMLTVTSLFWGILALLSSLIQLNIAMNYRSLSAYTVGEESEPFYLELSELFTTQHYIHLVFGVLEILLGAFGMFQFFRQESVKDKGIKLIVSAKDKIVKLIVSAKDKIVKLIVSNKDKIVKNKGAKNKGAKK
jgi:hypothetical protein